MYQMSNKIKMTSLILIVLGLIGVSAGFLSTPNNVEEVKQQMEASHGGHGDGHADAGHSEGSAAEEEHAVGEHHDDEKSHAEHAYTFLKNKPWSALFVSLLFFLLISLGAFVFYVIQHVSQAGWSPVLFRVMEAISKYIVPGGVLVYVFLVLSSLHLNHLFVWMDPEIVANDEVIQEKSGYLNIPFFLIRAAIYIGGWILFQRLIIKNENKQDDGYDQSLYKKNITYSVLFLAFFAITESMASWDWIMSIDTHWFSTLMGWFVFASMFVSGITTIALVTVHLKSKGHLEFVNNSHIHDLAKFMFGISIFWTYLWFAQFMLIWYANMPEEAVYYVTRMEDYQLLFLGSVALNFVFPLLILMNSDFKRVNWIVTFAGIIILIGHYINFYLLIMPGTVAGQWSISFAEIGSLLLVGGIFLYVTFNALSKKALQPVNNPLIKESKQYHY